MFELPKEAIVSYLRRRETDLDLLRQDLAEHSLKNFRRIGHQLRGNARSFGFDELEPIAERLEAVTESNLDTDGRLAMDEYMKWLQGQIDKYNIH